jgi:hypothetical protein
MRSEEFSGCFDLTRLRDLIKCGSELLVTGAINLDDFSDIDTAISLGIEQNASWDLDVAARGLTVYQFVSLSRQNRFMKCSERAVRPRVA